MSCSENNKSLIINVQYIESKYIDTTGFAQPDKPGKISYKNVITNANKSHLKKLIMNPESAQFSSSMIHSVGGIKFKNELKFSMSIPTEDPDNEFTQINNLTQSTYSLIITYFGGEQSFVYAPQNCMLYSFEQSDGKYECTITIENLTECRQLV